MTLSSDGQVNGVRVRSMDGSMRTMHGDAVMLACGGFEGNDEMLTQYLGKSAVDLKKLVPALRFNTGDGIRMAREIGAASAGQFGGAHMEAVDIRCDRPDAAIPAHNFCIVVNSDAKRFCDEGEKDLLDSFEQMAVDIWERAGNKAFFITDEAVIGNQELYRYFGKGDPPEKANSIEKLAIQLGGTRSAGFASRKRERAASSPPIALPNIACGKRRGENPHGNNRHDMQREWMGTVARDVVDIQQPVGRITTAHLVSQQDQ